MAASDSLVTIWPAVLGGDTIGDRALGEANAQSREGMKHVASLEAQALDLFDTYAEMTPAARARALRALRQSDPALHAHVERLLDADASPEYVLESPQKILSECRRVGAQDTADPRLGTMLGAWRIENVIGNGGMGRVYLASRADGQYAQMVALKCVSIDATSPALAQVIRNERDMLAMLEHPNIATLLDGGVDHEGCPWFAMQLVQGEAIDAWCDARCLDLRARVALFVQLCEGLRYAHDKGALHSDLKPPNVLVDDGGRPVLLDFGLSSLTARSHGGMLRRVAMTFGYTAPEVAADGYSVASDIYALGVMLCGLVCGSGPQHAAAITTEPVPALLPSQYALQGPDDAARLRGLPSAAALSRALTGDLDSIVAACLTHDPAKRPASVAQIQTDLRAWLAFRPVSARRQDMGYRLRLFLRRHPTAAVAASLVLVAAGAGIATGVHLHGQATDHAETAQSMRRLFEQSFDALTTGALGQSLLSSAPMLRDTEANLRASEAAGRVDASTASLMLVALARSHTTLGDYRHAMSLLNEAQARAAGLEAQQAPLKAALAHLLNIQSQHRQARHLVEQGLAHIDAVPAVDREVTRLMLEVELARAQWGMAQIETARATLQQALVSAEVLVERDPRPLAALLIQRGQWLRQFSRPEAAMADFERAALLTRERAPILADDAAAEVVAMLGLLDQRARAVEVAEALLERRRHMLGEDHPETGKAWGALGHSHFWNGQVDTALEYTQRSMDLLAATLGEEHPETLRAMMVHDTIRMHGGDATGVVDNARRALAVMERVHGPDHQATMRAVGYLAAALAATSARSGDLDTWNEVIALFARRVDTGRRQGLPVLSERMMLIKARLRVGQVDEGAQQELADIIAALVEARGPVSDAVSSARFTLVEVYLKLGKDDLGKAMLEEMLHDLSSAPVTLMTQVEQINCHEKLGDIAWKGGDIQAARAHWERALQIDGRIASGKGPARRIEGKLAQVATR